MSEGSRPSGRNERRGESRVRRRIPCELWIEGRRHSGMILDFSAQGFYVQTSARPRPGSEVGLVARFGRGSEPLRLETQVARRYVVPPALRRLAHGGIGLEVMSEDAEVRALLEAGPDALTGAGS